MLWALKQISKKEKTHGIYKETASLSQSIKDVMRSGRNWQNMNDQQKWFESLNLNSPHQRYVIVSPDHKVIGTANLVDINWKDRNASHGLLIGDQSARGKGYAADTIMAIMRYAFEELGLNRLETTIIAYNDASLGVYMNRCGWKQEGVQREWYFRKNRYWDRFVMGITRSEYAGLMEKNNYWNGE